jgi:hypothetical protein
MKPKDLKQTPAISKKATKNPKAAGAGFAPEMESRRARGKNAAASRPEKAIGGQRQIEGHQASSTRRSQTRRDSKNR